MNDDAATITLDRSGACYKPGEPLTGTYALTSNPDREVVAVEFAVVWNTAGKGDEDMGVHFTERFSADVGDAINSIEPRRFKVQLPQSPLSYDGVLIRIHWSVRVRVEYRRGKAAEVTAPFLLGSVAPAQEVPKARGRAS
jgi:hypothetical protein